jgi:hypothetical protein
MCLAAMHLMWFLIGCGIGLIVCMSSGSFIVHLLRNQGIAIGGKLNAKGQKRQQEFARDQTSEPH